MKGQESSAIRSPSQPLVNDHVTSISEQHLVLDIVWCTMDGLKLWLHRAGNNKFQNMFYNGWANDQYVSSVLGFAPDGTTPRICCYNVPGSRQDSYIAKCGNIYNNLERCLICME